MSSDIPNDLIELCMVLVKEIEPYPLSILDYCIDNNKIDDSRYAATMALKRLLEAGYSEDEVNPWKNKQ